MTEGETTPEGNGATRGAVRLRPAHRGDVPLILTLIRELAEYERLLHEVVATPGELETHLFGERPGAQVILAEWQDPPGEGEPVPAGFALHFPTFSTFLGRPGIHLEDLFVRPAFRGRGIGRALLAHLAGIVVERGWGRLEWNVLDWNEPAIGFYRGLGAGPMDEWTTFRLTGEALEALAAAGPPRPQSP